MTEGVERLVAMAHMLDAERVSKIAEAYRRRGRPHAMFAFVAAKKAGRSTEVSTAMREMSMMVNLAGIVRGYDPDDIEAVAWAARNAGVAVATEDLIGLLAYSTKEYGDLIDPWFAGFSDMPVTTREEETA